MKTATKFYSYLLTILLIGLCLYCWDQCNDGFSIYQITSSIPPSSEFEVELSMKKKETLQQVMNQSFRYIGKGCQSYVFESEDEKFVIKFFKHKHLRLYPTIGRLPMPAFLRKTMDAKRERRQQRISTLFTSCKIAYEELSEESGLVFVHLHRKPVLEMETRLIDKMGFKHWIWLDDHEFVIQKKGTLLSQVFRQESENKELIRERIQQLFHLILARCEKGIADLDPAFVQNVAYCLEENRAIFLDVGQFYKNLDIQNLENQKGDVERRLNEVCEWCRTHFPALAPLIDEECNRLLA